MKTMNAVNFYEYELQAIFQYEEYGCYEARPNQDEQHLAGSSM